MLHQIAKWRIENPDSELDYTEIFEDELRTLHSSYLEETRSMMLSNMGMGVLLVLLILGLFLRLQLAAWVMLGMPIAFLGAFALLPLAGGSVNMLSLFGFILVLGIVVDDAIIIGESVQTSTEREGLSLDRSSKARRKLPYLLHLVC